MFFFKKLFPYKKRCTQCNKVLSYTEKGQPDGLCSFCEYKMASYLGGEPTFTLKDGSTCWNCPRLNHGLYWVKPGQEPKCPVCSST